MIAHHETPDRLAMASAALAGKHVLVVEDNGMLCYDMEKTLRAVGCEIVGPYGRLRDAMANVPRARIDIALLDINLHGELVTPVAALLRERGVPFLLISAYGADELPVELSGQIQLRKPFTDSDLVLGLAASCGAQ